MDIASLSTDLSLSSVGGQIDAGVLAAVQSLDKNVEAELFASIGLGGSFDGYA
jgi:hypothetical protein